MEGQPPPFPQVAKPGVQVGVYRGRLAADRRDGLTREVVGRRAEAAGRDDEVGRVEGRLYEPEG